MNIEVEIKVKVDGLSKIRDVLRRKGRLKKSIRQIDEYYVPCQRDFFVRKPAPVEWLRIRTNPDSYIFEYDRSIEKKEGGQDYAEEYEVEIIHPEVLRKILKFLNFREVVAVDKKREYWSYNNYEVCLDKVKGLGNFVEVEAKGKFKNSNEARKKCWQILNELAKINFQKKEIKTGYPVLLMKK